MYAYSVKVRGKAYLWGSDGVLVALAAPLYLVVHNDRWGEPTEISTEDGGAPEKVAVLQPGECWTVPLQGLNGVFATADADSLVACTIVAPQT